MPPQAKKTELTKLRELARNIGFGDSLNCQWILLYCFCVFITPLVLLVVYAIVKSMRFKMDFIQKQNRGEDEEVPHTDPVEFYYYSCSPDHQAICACLLEKQPDATLYDVWGPIDEIDKYLKVNPCGTLPLLVHNGRPVRDVNQVFMYIEKKLDGPSLLVEGDKDKEIVRHWYLGCPNTAKLTLREAVQVLSSPAAVVEDDYALLEVCQLILKSPDPAKYIPMIKRCLLRPFKPIRKIPGKLIASAAFSSIAAIIKELEARLKEGLTDVAKESRECIVDTFSVADLFLATRFKRLEELGVLDSAIGDNKSVRAYWSRLQQRESVKVACKPPSPTRGSEAVAHCLAAFAKEVAERGAVSTYQIAGDDEDEEEE